ncbi:MAG: bacterial type and secretion system family protein [Herbaspirillum sp.]|nr:bacterial type and secretion system family protein [Herbaspirillum sp.]
MSKLTLRASKGLLILALASLFSGCAVTRAIDTTEQLSQQGQGEAAIENLQAAKKNNPEDLRLDSAMYKQVGNLVARYQREADEALAAGDETTALERLNTVLKYDNGNMRARQTIDQLDSQRHLKALLADAKKLADSKPEEALKLIQQVLEERPSWSDAIQIRDSVMRRIAESNTLSPTLDSSLKKPVSLTFRSHNLMSIFDTISRLAGVNFVFDAEVPKGATASISATRTTAEDAINLLLATNQLRKKVLNHNTLLIYPARANKDREYRDMAVKTFFLSHANAKSVSAAMKSMIKVRDVHVDERINAIVLRDAPETLELASRLVQALDRPEFQLAFDVRRNHQHQFGF